jgi:hypothetical protein
MITIKVEFLNEYTDRIKHLTNHILDSRNKFNVLINEDEARELIEAMAELKFVLATTQLA